MRTLESAALAAGSGALEPHTGTTDIFISPGFEFRLVGGLLTNFHLPQSSLLMLVSAFAGRERVLAAYRHAVAGRLPVLQLWGLHVCRVIFGGGGTTVFRTERRGTIKIR